MTPRRPRIAVLGGGIAGLAAAWRLSEPGWRDRYDSITVHQRGWRLGGKGASSRGENGRIEEHGLHLWLGSYDNAFRLMREVYGELDRPRTDPEAPVRTWREAFFPAGLVGLEDRADEAWEHWLADFSPNDREPGAPLGERPSPTLADLVVRGVRLVGDFVDSLPAPAAVASGPVGARSPAGHQRAAGGASELRGVDATMLTGVRVLLPGLLVEALRLVARSGDGDAGPGDPSPVVRLADELHRRLGAAVDADAARRRGWQHVSLAIAMVRGLAADGVLTDPRRLHDLDDDDFRCWMRRHGAAPEALDGAFLRGMYDLAFAYEGGDPSRPSFGAGTGVKMAGKMLLDHDGAVFWKMGAGMGDVVFAPLHEALVARGVTVEYFSRVDALHLDAAGLRVEAVSVGRQARLRPGVAGYDPLVRVGGLPCYPDRPLVDQLDADPAVAHEPLEAAWCTWPDAEARVLRDGEDFDVVVLAIPVGAAPTVCAELIAARPEWRAMVDGMATVATQSAQLWLREDERSLGWPEPGAVVSGYVDPLGTWASMPHLPPVEAWPGEPPRTVAYLCSVLEDEPGAAPVPDAATAARARARVTENVVRFLRHDIGGLLPGTTGSAGFRHELLWGADGDRGAAAVATQHVAANVDPSDRYVQSPPGSARVRLRPDESGVDNLVLAGDWTDSGVNAGCIEAAVLSGLQAANAVAGRDRNHRVTSHDLY